MAEHDSEREPEEKAAPASSPGDSAGTPPAGTPAGRPPSGDGDRDGNDGNDGNDDRNRNRNRNRDRDRDRGGDGQNVPFDEDAAWRAIVAGYGEEPPDPPGTKPFKSVEDLALLEAGSPDDAAPSGNADATDTGATSDDEQGGPATTRPLGSSVAFAPGVGPRDYRLAEPDGDGQGTKSGKGGDAEDDEGHFVPPEPPPLPAADTTARFAWLGVMGGPLLLLLAVLLGWHMTWWLATLGIGGFLGGFATLVVRMKDDDEENDDPGRGAVV
ncbi:hypothetical protein GCM10010145_40800 [Streptomyces ruber]|uniref:DUF308 domain-containing protein n=2 Tax=Streptomyces TaxID=1883 RepID=A0A918ETP9_9ACTN|nr:hypothetical protein [Streptomyces ruber]GGQ66899.1 hypothetical protein GCM10010145_40800 [Streptomyces ruber]